MSGNSHQRKIIETAVARVLKSKNEAGVSVTEAIAPLSTPISLFSRLKLFFDHGSLQTILGIIGGLVGTFLDGRYLACLCLWIAWTINSSAALKGLKTSTRLVIYIAAIVFSAPALYRVGIKINTSKPHIFTPADYLAAIKHGTTLPITQQITNVYNSYKAAEIPIGEPIVDLTEWKPDGNDADGFNWNSDISNSGTAPALSVIGTVKSDFLPQSKASEDEVFSYIESHAFDEDAPKADLAPGKDHMRIQPLKSRTLTQAEIDEWHLGNRVIYLGEAEAYKDSRGNRYISELCMYLEAKSQNGRYCSGHNSVKRISGKS